MTNQNHSDALNLPVGATVAPCEYVACPFCGKTSPVRLTSNLEDDDEYIVEEYWAVVCDASKYGGKGPGGCGAQGGYKPTKEEAIAAWTRRAVMQQEPFCYAAPTVFIRMQEQDTVLANLVKRRVHCDEDYQPLYTGPQPYSHGATDQDAPTVPGVQKEAP